MNAAGIWVDARDYPKKREDISPGWYIVTRKFHDREIYCVLNEVALCHALSKKGWNVVKVAKINEP